jgi:hypothetical protein
VGGLDRDYGANRVPRIAKNAAGVLEVLPRSPKVHLGLQRPDCMAGHVRFEVRRETGKE